jgi:ribulose-phosphate 3-epimerase
LAIPEAVRREVHLLPSVLSADFARLGQQVSEVMDAGASIIHIDVMDGHFVPNITIGPLVVAALESVVHGRGGYFSVHLMIERPDDFVGAFVQAGADSVTVHSEACAQIVHTLETIRGLGASPGVALNPGSDIGRVGEVAELVDHVLVMTVNPGFGGQELIAAALDKVPLLRRMLPQGVAIEVDGGVHKDNIRRVVEMGGNWVIAGSAVFGGGTPGADARALHGLMVGGGSL